MPCGCGGRKSVAIDTLFQRKHFDLFAYVPVKGPLQSNVRICMQAASECSSCIHLDSSVLFVFYRVTLIGELFK